MLRRSRLKRRTPIRTTREKRTGRRDTGPDRATRETVLERDDYRCVACAKPISDGPYSVQHRVARQMGGTKRPAANSPVNLITLCGSATSGCHLWCEQRTQEARDLGYWLPSWEDPSAVPVDHAVYGLVYLLPNGHVEPVPHLEAS